MILSYALVGLTAFALVRALYKRLTRPSLSMIRGPESPSFIFGNMLELYQRPVGEADFAWQSQYGNIIRFKSVFGGDQLMITDPRAMQKILSTSSDSFPRPSYLRVLLRTMNGEGIVTANGEDHKRQRTIMLPGFGSRQSRAFLPKFKDCADALSARWVEIIEGRGPQTTVVDVTSWLSRGALDAIGLAAFDVQFGTLQDDLHPLAKKYKNYLEVFVQAFVQAFSTYIPTPVLQWMADNSPSPRLARARDVKKMATAVARELVREKSNALLLGKGNTDFFTLLVKANMDANAKMKLSDEEMFSQLRSLLLAGHETTSATISWILLELARNPKSQFKLRNEIRKSGASVCARGDSQLKIQDLETMPYLNAVIKEGLRLHPAGHQTSRTTLRDEILPLSKPILTKSGATIDEVLVPGGTEIVISIAAFNRDKDIWGEDAHEFRPERWLNDGTCNRQLPGIGVYSHLMSFSTGTRACPGWRFAVAEMQAFVSTLVGKFEFAETDKANRIVRQPVRITVPMIDGEFDRGVQLPLAISLAPQDDEI